MAELEESNDETSEKNGDNLAEKSEKVKKEEEEEDEEIDEEEVKPKHDDLGGADGDEGTDEKGKKEREIGKKASAAAKKTPDLKGKPSDASAKAEDAEKEGEDLLENKKMTKAQHIEAISKMKKADIEEMLAGFASKLEEADKAESEAELKKLEDAKAEIEEKIKSISVKEDVAALIEGEDLSEEFKTKAATIFEAAVKSKMRSEVERIIVHTQAEKEVEMESYKDELTEKVDTYLNYVVDEWTKENELAIERGLKGEIAEDFISGLKQLFEDHYIDVPDEKYDVLEAQSDKITELEEKLNDEIQKNIEVKEANSKLVREQVISEVSDDLADTEVEKFIDLTKDVDFSGEDSFREKLNTLKENYFPKMKTSDDNTTSSSDDEETTGLAQDVEMSGRMAIYASAITNSK